MSKKIKYGIGIVVILILCVLYANVDKMHNVYDGAQDNSSYVTIGPVTEMGSVTQSFASAEEKIDGIAFKVSYSEEMAEGTLDYRLTDETGEELVSGEVPIREIQSGRICKVSFENRIQVEKGERLTISFGSSELSEGQAVYLYYEQIPKDGTALEVNGERAGGCMILRTYVHRFDAETFIVTLGFAVYIIVFLRVLYKLFS